MFVQIREKYIDMIFMKSLRKKQATKLMIKIYKTRLSIDKKVPPFPPQNDKKHKKNVQNNKFENSFIDLVHSLF